MRALLRDAISFVRDAGGTDVRVSHGSKHTFVEFNANGRAERVPVHSGNITSKRFERMFRSQIRRKMEKTTP
ncbi:hypothetical protein KQX64_06880 [Rhodopseudomonas palustris]|nr:hypothetical protein KQX64_06880 [Rhodopseudomonas palustris]